MGRKYGVTGEARAMRRSQLCRVTQFSYLRGAMDLTHPQSEQHRNPTSTKASE